MSLQVGALCYATAIEAGRAACSQFSSVTTINGDIIKTVTCSASDALTGDLQLSIASTDLISQITTTQIVAQPLNYPPCIAQDYIDAIELLIGALLVVFIVWHGGFRMLSFLGWTRGSQND